MYIRKSIFCIFGNFQNLRSCRLICCLQFYCNGKQKTEFLMTVNDLWLWNENIMLAVFLRTEFFASVMIHLMCKVWWATGPLWEGSQERLIPKSFYFVSTNWFNVWTLNTCNLKIKNQFLLNESWLLYSWLKTTHRPWRKNSHQQGLGLALWNANDW